MSRKSVTKKTYKKPAGVILPKKNIAAVPVPVPVAVPVAKKHINLRTSVKTGVKLCNKKTIKGEKCTNAVFRVKGENDTKCRLHYLMAIHHQDDDEEPETVQECAAPVIEGLLWIGSITAVRNKELLKKYKIKGIINASGIEPIPSVMKDYNELGISYHTFTTYENGIEKFFIDSPFNKYPDFTKKDFFRYIIQGVKILKSELKQRPVKKPIMVNCHMGMNRSAAILAGYLILVGGMSFERALKLLQKANKTRGLDVLTNPSFRKGLKELEEKRHLIIV
jgi:hypothetical protein